MDFQWLYSDADATFQDARQVRQHVFVQEQGYSLEGEFDSLDKTSFHIIGYKNGRPVTAARLFQQQPGEYHIGRVAVLKESRGQGAGMQMIREMIAKAKQLGAESILLSAQQDKSDFYKKAGFHLTGNHSLDEGQLHVEMQIKL